MVEPLTFELCYRREAYRKVGNALVRDEERDKTLPERPPQFKPLIGDWPTVQDRADELNEAQARSGFRHYFFFPEVAPAKTNSDHCDMCKRLARRGQL